MSWRTRQFVHWKRRDSSGSTEVLLRVEEKDKLLIPVVAEVTAKTKTMGFHDEAAQAIRDF